MGGRLLAHDETGASRALGPLYGSDGSVARSCDPPLRLRGGISGTWSRRGRGSPPTWRRSGASRLTSLTSSAATASSTGRSSAELGAELLAQIVERLKPAAAL